MITSNVIHRLFRIRYGNGEATAFTLDVDRRQYLLTAKHAVVGLADRGEVALFANGAWIPQQVRLIGHAPDDRDISVLAMEKVMTPPHLVMDATSKGVIYGQDVFFLGFPYGFLGKYVLTDAGYPLPFVKRATVSLLDEGIFLLDRHNNPGFSGGPVVFTEPGRSEFKVFAVISGYRAVDEPIYVDQTPVVAGSGQRLVFRYNTGIIVTWAIDYALELIQANPDGVLLPGTA